MNAAQHKVPSAGSALKPPVRAQVPPEPAPVVAAAGDPEALAPPPAVQRHSREPLNTKIRIDLRKRLNDFVERHDSTLQGVLEAALDEYMARRKWSW
ncbi:MAG: hypothetical protein ACRDJ9_36040, partial [Dehalococcoidia bacterium]